jgi:membrane protein required for beta-lactamase induction
MLISPAGSCIRFFKIKIDMAVREKGHWYLWEHLKSKLPVVRRKRISHYLFYVALAVWCKALLSV